MPPVDVKIRGMVIIILIILIIIIIIGILGKWWLTSGCTGRFDRSNNEKSFN